MGDGLLCNDPVDLLENQPGSTDVYGTPSDNWVVIASGLASVQPLNGPEYTGDRDTTVVRAKLISEDMGLWSIGQKHRVTVRGETYTVDGHPQHFYWLGQPDHVECYLKYLEG